MPIVTYLPGGQYTRPILLSDIGKRDITWKNGAIYHHPQSQYIEPNTVAVLKNTPDVQMSIAQGKIRQFVNMGIFAVDFFPYLALSTDILEFNAALDSLTSGTNPTLTFRIMNLGDDPATGGANIPFSILNNTNVASGPAELCSDKNMPYNFIASAAATLIGENIETFNFPVGAVPLITSTVAGPYIIIPGQNTLRIQYSNHNYPLEFIMLPTGIQTTIQIANAINAHFPGLASATAPPNGFLQLAGLTSGAGITIRVGAEGQSSTANATVGFSVNGEFAQGVDDVDHLDIEIDGVRNTVPLIQGAARTATQVANDINAVFAGTADVVSKRVRITSTTVGNVSSIKIYDALANSAVGFTNGQTAQGYLGNINFAINVDGVPQTIIFPTGSRTNTQVVTTLTVLGLTPYTVGDSFCIATTSSGINSSLQIIPETSGSTAFATLGFTMGESDQGHNGLANFINTSIISGYTNQIEWPWCEASLNVSGILANLTPGIYTGYLLVSAAVNSYNNPIMLPVSLNLSATS